MSDINYNNSARMIVEVREIIKHLDEELSSKIPQRLKDVLNRDVGSDYQFEYNTEKSLMQQDICEDTRNFLFLMYRDYWCLEREKEELQQRLIDAKNEKMKRYSENNIF